jgi:predicted PurR-regulated permease PerM
MPTKNQVSFEKMRSTLFFSLIIALSIALIYLLKPFFYPIFWAAIIAVLAHPVYIKINKYINTPSLSSVIGIILVIVLIFLPLVLLTLLLIQQVLILYTSISADGLITNVKGLSSWLSGTPFAPFIEAANSQWNEYATSAIKTVSVFLFENVKNITQNSVRFVFMLFIMFYTLYYFFKDGKKITDRLMHLSPIGGKYEKMLYDKFRTTAVSTLKTTLVIGGIQGTIGGMLFFITGINGALLWGVIMTVLSIIPAIGSFLVWLPAGVIMLATGHLWQGFLILIVGTFVISMIDNILRPIFVGKDTAMHPLIVLFSTLGGIVIFGVSGFIIGPIIASLFLAVISIYAHYYRNELQNN